jgi:hypothetical protein
MDAVVMFKTLVLGALQPAGRPDRVSGPRPALVQEVPRPEAGGPGPRRQDGMDARALDPRLGIPLGAVGQPGRVDLPGPVRVICRRLAAGLCPDLIRVSARPHGRPGDRR